MIKSEPHELRAQALRCRSVAERYEPRHRRPIIELADDLESKAADLERKIPR